MNSEPRACVFVGSFNPFTIGHDSIVRRALPLFDRLVIGVVGDQVHKPNLPPAEVRIKAIRELYADEPRIEVRPYFGLAVEFASSVGARYIIKGVRSVKDFEYEREQADINRQISGGEVETLLLYSEPHLSSVSSSMVRELQHFGLDVSQFLPVPSPSTLHPSPVLVGLAEEKPSPTPQLPNSSNDNLHS